MDELTHIDERTQPANIFLVCDAMIGQDAVNTARAFNERLDLDGVILTKLDGDARGGAALSIKAVTGKPIKFLGMGEQLEKLEEFRPEGLASRILGMGDIVGLMQDFEEVVDAEKAEEDALRMLKGKFDMQDFLDQIGMLKRMGSLSDLLAKMPFFPDGLPEGVSIDDKELVKIEAMISSMTAQERAQPERFVVTSWQQIMDGQGNPKRKRAADFEPDRVKRVARGSGRKEAEVKELLNKFAMMRQMMLSLGHQSGLLGKIPGLRQLQQMRQLGNMDIGKLMPQLGGMGGMGGFMGGGGGFGGAARAPIRNMEKAKLKAKRKKQKQDRKRSKKRK
jgi:signal recognition particle subunit SRP54